MYCTVKALTLLLESYKQRNQGLTVKKEIKTLESRQIYRNWECSRDAAPEDVARGELKEETGLSAGKMEYVGYQKLAQGYSAQGYHIYLATELTFTGQQLEEEEYGLTVKKIKISAFAQLIRDGKITDATSVTAFLLARTKNMFS